MIIVDVKDFKLIYHRRQASGTKYFQGSKQGIAQKILLDKLVALHTFNSWRKKVRSCQRADV